MDKLISQFSEHLFWDIDRSKLDLERHKTWLVGRVLEYGLMQDWLLLNKSLGLKEITERAKELRYMDPVSFNFIVTISGEPKEEFRCFYGQTDPGTTWQW